ncbi:hypothetical protein IAT40_001503 [Kwoniella sp. CBS 6097]
MTHPFGNPPPFEDPAFAGAFGIPSAPPQDPPMINYRGHTLQQSFDLRKRMAISHEKPMLGMFLTAFFHVSVARIAGQSGYDFTCIDWEHTPYNPETIIEIIKTIQYAGEGQTATIVRVPSLDHQYAAWCLDAGASGIVFPHISTVEQAKAAVKACRFPPHGHRSFPPSAFQLGFNDGAPNGGGAFENWARAAVILQIEDVEGAENAEEIAAVEQIDGLMVGPGDLALSLGLGFADIGVNPRWIELVTKITMAAKKHKLALLVPGMSAAQMGPQLAMGATMVCAANDGAILARGLRNELVEGRKIVETWQTERQNGKSNGTEE